MNRDEFLQNVEKTPHCWIWKGVTFRGRGMISLDGRTTPAPRLAYQLFIGPIPKGRFVFVCHSCDNPACVNPAHLFLGNPKSNAEDRNRKGRQARGEKINIHKLTTNDIVEIRRLSGIGMNQTDIAQKFGVTQPNIHYILQGKTWNWFR